MTSIKEKIEIIITGMFLSLISFIFLYIFLPYYRSFSAYTTHLMYIFHIGLGIGGIIIIAYGIQTGDHSETPTTKTVKLLCYECYEKYKRKVEEHKTKANTSTKKLFDKVVDEIEKLKLPKRQLKREESYHLSLYVWLKKSFPSAKIEEQRGGARPDISIDDIAIEVKGPTKNPDLNSIANKCLIYPQYFPDGLIVVLFAVNVHDRRYNEWLKGMRKSFPDVRVIRK